MSEEGKNLVSFPRPRAVDGVKIIIDNIKRSWRSRIYGQMILATFGTISDVFIPEAEYTMAFGGVATGSMKAYEQARVAGSIKYRGLTAMDRDWEKTFRLEEESID